MAWLLFTPLLQGAVSSQPPQASTSPSQDPLMSLMAVQPKVEIPAVTKATVMFDPPMVRPGERAFLRVVLNALETSIVWPTNLAGPP
ncbi:MAG: hypothetical protein NT154_28785, partial [Verrucomicrobia bacterium]|nr:hypothetical protein [Verrucomicrobiota bacterium]